MNHKGVNQLARTIQCRMNAISAHPALLDFGTIQYDMSLLTDQFPKPIPLADYVVCRSVCYDPEIPLTVTDEQHYSGEGGYHYHNVNLPRRMYRIQPGDRVLVAWVGDDAVVVDIIMATTEMM